MKPLSLYGLLAAAVLATIAANAEAISNGSNMRGSSEHSGDDPSPDHAGTMEGGEHLYDETLPRENFSPESGIVGPPDPLAVGCASCFGEPACPPRPVRFAFGEYLYWNATNALLDYAILDDFGAAAISGDTASLEYEAESGVRAGFGYQVPSGWDLRFSYSGLESTDHQTVEGIVYPTLSHPSFNILATNADAVADLDYDVLDLEFGHSFLVSEWCQLRVHGGLRGARVDQAIDVRYEGGDFAGGFVARSHNFDGLGLRIGAEGTWQVCYGIGLFGRIGGSLLAGNLESHALESDDLGLIVDVSRDNDVVIPVTEIAMGIGWQGRHWQLQCGYEVTSWYNLSQRIEFHDDVHVASFSKSQDVLGLHGLFGRVAYGW